MRGAIYIISFISILFSYENNLLLLSDMFEKSGWIPVNRHSDSLMVYKKKIEGAEIPAFKATMLSSVPFDYIMEAVLDGENHEEFMGSSHVIESEFLGTRKDDTTYCYQMLDLPIVSDRHYITTNFNDTIVSGEHYRLNWMVENNKNNINFKDFINAKNDKHGNPIFISDGAGSWEIKRIDEFKTEVNYYVLIDPGGWIPNPMVSYVNKSLGPDTVIMMVREGERRYRIDDSPRHILFTLEDGCPELIIEYFDKSKMVARNNINIQILINIHNFRKIEKWLPDAENVSLDKIYKLDVGRKKIEEVKIIEKKLSDLPCIMNAEIQYPRRYLKKH